MLDHYLATGDARERARAELQVDRAATRQLNDEAWLVVDRPTLSPPGRG
jgi:hypothetical protein